MVQNPNDFQPVLVTVEVAAKMLSLSKSHVYELIKNGELPAHHFGTSVRVAPDELKAWLAERREKAS